MANFPLFRRLTTNETYTILRLIHFDDRKNPSKRRKNIDFHLHEREIFLRTKNTLI